MPRFLPPSLLPSFPPSLPPSRALLTARGPSGRHIDQGIFKERAEAGEEEGEESPAHRGRDVDHLTRELHGCLSR